MSTRRDFLHGLAGGLGSPLLAGGAAPPRRPPVPGLYRYLDYPDVASLAMPAALLVINGSQDALFELDGVRACFEKLKACYKKAGIPDRLRTRLYDAPHEFNAEMQAEAWQWLKKWV